VNEEPKRRVQILLAEDNPADVFLVRQALEGKPIDFELQVVEDGEKAMQLIETADANGGEFCPEVLLLDLNLPRRGGSEVLQWLNENQRRPGAKVVILSSSDSPTDRAEAARLGARYFRKPSSLEEFLKIGDVVMELIGAK
jgi:chemotaxis family two-component system response regulator Rcp1